MARKLPYTSAARRIASAGWKIALIPPALAGLYALVAGGGTDWFRFFAITALAVPTLLGVAMIGVLCEISVSLAARPGRAAPAAKPQPAKLHAAE